MQERKSACNYDMYALIETGNTILSLSRAGPQACARPNASISYIVFMEQSAFSAF